MQFSGLREANRNNKRRIDAGSVLNIRQWFRRGEARFTLEGEGCEVWVRMSTGRLDYLKNNNLTDQPARKRVRKTDKTEIRLDVRSLVTHTPDRRCRASKKLCW